MLSLFNVKMYDFKKTKLSEENHTMIKVLNNLRIKDITIHKLYLFFMGLVIVAILRLFDLIFRFRA